MPKLKEILEETIKNSREDKCLICEYRYDKNGCILYQIKNRDYCKRDLTDSEIVVAVISKIKSLIKEKLPKKKLIIKNIHTGKNVEFMEMGGSYETDHDAVIFNQALTEIERIVEKL